MNTGPRVEPCGRLIPPAAVEVARVGETEAWVWAAVVPRREMGARAGEAVVDPPLPSAETVTKPPNASATAASPPQTISRSG